MEYRSFGRTGWQISSVGFGSWAIGGAGWGTTDDQEALQALHEAIDQGVNFIDTADVYGDGHAEQLIARLQRERAGETIYVATKAGRRLNPHTAAGYNRQNLTEFIERSLQNLQTSALDLVQLHCPPSPVYDMPEVFGILDDLVTAGKLRYYGVSVERVDEALKAITYPNVQSVQIIFNMFRLKPTDEFFAAAQQHQVGILARVPLASGLLTGKFRPESQFDPLDHRNFNREGASFDRGETFSGVDYETGLKAVEELQKLVPSGVTLAQFALRWILMFEAISSVIPGAKNVAQARENVQAAALPALSTAQMEQIAQVYDTYFRAQVHPQW